MWICFLSTKLPWLTQSNPSVAGHSWHWFFPAGGTFESATGGTFESDIPGTFQTVTNGTFHSATAGTFQSDTGGTFIPLLSWQQTIQQKIRNQASVLSRINGIEVGNMLVWASSVKSGDSDNMEGRAAAYYWRNLFPDNPQFTRNRDEPGINALLNYGYAILRAVIARALVASGLLPTLGIHHHNKYNAYCLVDDIMEPYRPYVDELVLEVIKNRGISNKIDIETKRDLLGIPVLDTILDGERRPLMISASDTAASLNKCYSGEIRKVKYPTMPI